MTELFFDTETRSPHSLRARGTDVYMNDAECIMGQYAIDDGAVKIWEPWREPFMPRELDDALADPSVTIIAHNARFDRALTTRVLKRRTAVTRWRCSMAQSHAHGLPGGLAGVASALAIPEDQRKLSFGKDLIQLFCVPRKDGTFVQPWDAPAEWELFVEYGKQDVASMRYIYRRLPTHNYRGDALRTWHLNELITERGFRIDRPLMEKGVILLAGKKARDDAVLAEKTASAVTAATQRQKLLNYLVSKGVDIPNLKASTVKEWLKCDDLSPELKFVLTMRLEAAKSSGSKYKRGLSLHGLGDRIRFALKFCGAGRTGRFSATGFQPHNMARPSKEFGEMVELLIGAIMRDDLDLITDKVNTVCADILRSSITATPGNEMTVADWSNIEGRILAWVCDHMAEIRQFEAQDRGEAEDAYSALYAAFFNVPVKSVTSYERQIGKVVKLAMGYLGGVGAFATMAISMGVDLSGLPGAVLPKATPEQMKKAEKAWRRAFLENEDYALEPDVYIACDVLKQLFRDANKPVVETGYDLDRAVKTAIRERGRVFHVAKCKIWCTATFLIIELPSGRRLLYADPQILISQKIDPETGKSRTQETVTYMTARGDQWRCERAWMGLFLENIVQAIANDVLRLALLRVHNYCQSVPEIKAHLRSVGAETAIALHVHDEIACDVPPGTLALAKLIEIMLVKESWMRGLPMAAAGYVSFRLKKG